MALWLYAGPSFMIYRDVNLTSYIPNPPYEHGYYHDAGSYIKYFGIRPAVQVMFKYNPIRNIYVGIGGSYHYIDKYLSHNTLNLSAGVQF